MLVLIWFQIVSKCYQQVGKVAVPKKKLSPPVFVLTVPRRCFFCGSLLLFIFHVCLCYTGLSVPCNLVSTCWNRADLLTFLCVMLSCVSVTFPYGVLGQMWYLIVSIPDLYLLFNFKYHIMSYCFCYIHYFVFRRCVLSKSAKLIEIESQAEQTFIEGHLDAGTFSSSWCL